MIRKGIRIVEEGDIIKIIANVKVKRDDEKTLKILNSIRIQTNDHYENDDRKKGLYGRRNILLKIFPEYTVKYIDTKKRIFLHTSQGKIRGRISRRLHMNLEGFKDFALDFYNDLRDIPY